MARSRDRRIEPRGVGMQRVRLGDQRRDVEPSVGEVLQCQQVVAQLLRRLREVEWEDGRGAEPPAGEQIDLRVAYQQGVVDLVERVVRRMPPPRRAALAGAGEAAEY